MTFLFCSHADYGFLGPDIVIAKELARRGHAVAFVADPPARAWLDRERLPYFPVAHDRPTGFGSQFWFEPAAVVLQCAYIQAAVKALRPDALIGHQLVLGPYVMRDVLGVPLAVVGLAAWMYPTRTGTGLWLLRDESAWRHDEFLTRLNAVRATLGMEALAADVPDTPIQGDLFLLRSVPALEPDLDDLPPRVHLVGAGLASLPIETAALDRFLGGLEGRRGLYVQDGRTFGGERFLDVLIDAYADTETPVVIDYGKTDGALPRAWPANIFAGKAVCQAAVLDRMAAVVTGGHSTVVLAALSHGVPLLLFPNGSGTTDIAARCLRAGVALVGDPATVTVADLRRDVEVLTSSPGIRAAAIGVQRQFQQYDTSTIASDLIETLAAERAPVTRERAAASSK